MLKKVLVKAYFSIAQKALRTANTQEDRQKLICQLTDIVPNLSTQYSTWEAKKSGEFDLEKLRSIHAFQISLVLKAISRIDDGTLKDAITIADIGDSAGTHLAYLKKLLIKKEILINGVSVNQDANAVRKIRKQGGYALQAKAENIHQLLGAGEKVDMFLSFQMLEHLMNPALFMHNMATKTSTDRFVITVPFLKSSRVGLKYLRRPQDSRRFTKINAENTHIFELSPDDWKLLLRFSGWKVVYQERFFMYPSGSFLSLFKYALRRFDFEGFWGAVLEKDLSEADLYKDW